MQTHVVATQMAKEYLDPTTTFKATMVGYGKGTRERERMWSKMRV